MQKKAITIAEQIEKLKNRGLQFDLGEAKAKEVLLDIGYYRLGFYELRGGNLKPILSCFKGL